MGKIDAVTPKGKKEGPSASPLVSVRLLWKNWGSRIPLHPPGLNCCNSQAPSLHPHRSEIAVLINSPFFTFIIPLSPEFGAWSTRGMWMCIQGGLSCPSSPGYMIQCCTKPGFGGEKARSRVIWLIPALASWANRRSTVEIWHTSVLFCPILVFL